MTRPHVPVLAGELIDVLDPQPGEVAVDCTFGAGGHARLVANRIGPTGLLVCIDRDPAAEERFEELAAEVPCQTRFLRMDYADGLPALAAEGIAADMVYLDLGVSSMQIDAWERGFSYSYDAPLDMRMDPEQELDARAIVNGWDERRLANAFQRYGEERYARPIARAIVKRRETRARSRRPASSPRRSSPRSPRRRASRAGIPPSASSRRSGSSSTTSSARSTAHCRRLGSCCGPAAAWRRCRSTRSRIAASSASSRIARAAASARPTCRSAHAGARPRPSS